MLIKLTKCYNFSFENSIYKDASWVYVPSFKYVRKVFFRKFKLKFQLKHSK